MKRVTIVDVAAAAGVSRATVSLVLRDEPRISAETRERVHRAIDEIGYVYDRRAAIMRTQRSMTIGMVVTDVRNPYFAELAMALEVALDGHGYSLLQAYSHDEHRREDRLLGVMVEHRVDGVILLPAKDTSAADLRTRLGAGGMPHLLIARRIRAYESDYIGADNVRAGKLLGEHLATQGYERVALVGGPTGSTARMDRQRGLRAGLKRHGVTLDAKMSFPGEANREGGVAALQALLEHGPLPDAIACYSDSVASGVVSGLRAAGLEPGRDVALGSFDDTPEAAIQHPGLTSVSTHPDRVGADGAKLLLERIATPELPPRTVLLDPHLSVRASSTMLERRRAA